MNRSNRIIDLWQKRAFPAYQGNEPYIYLSFAPFEIEEGLSVIDVLNRLGCRVRYDEKIPDGRYWTSDICNAIEGCSVFFEIIPPEYHFSLTKELASEFASRLEKRKIFAHLQIPETSNAYSSPVFFYCPTDDPSFPEFCHKAIEYAGYFSSDQTEPAIGKYDLMLDYYQTSEDWNRAFGGLLPQSLNLRTHESHGYLGHYPRSDEDVFTAVRYGKKEHFYLRGRSDKKDYEPNQADKQFIEKILNQNGASTREIAQRFESVPKVPKSGAPFPSDYPYKDEFEYLSSDDD